MNEMNRVEKWNVLLENKIIGIIELYRLNQPWFYCKFYPTQQYVDIKHLFEEELKILESEDYDSWNDYYDIISSKGLKLHNLFNQEIIEEMLVLHIQNDEAWFRY
jgi:hypothetical protein